MSEIPVEKRFAVLCEIVRAQHFAWHEAVVDLCPDVEAAEVTNRMWEVTGRETAKAYARRMDTSKPLAAQIAASIAWSSVCMGEDASVQPGDDGDEAFLVHNGCPWLTWHQKTHLLAEDRPGCDAWFRTSVEGVNEALGTKLRFETLEAMPDGAPRCRRRFWVED